MWVSTFHSGGLYTAKCFKNVQIERSVIFLASNSELPKEVSLKVIKGNAVRKTKSYNDIDLNNWKDYDQIETGTLWMFQSRARGAGHKFDYHGNYIPQIAHQLYSRFTKPGDIILDMFLGRGLQLLKLSIWTENVLELRLSLILLILSEKNSVRREKICSGY